MTGKNKARFWALFLWMLMAAPFALADAQFHQSRSGGRMYFSYQYEAYDGRERSLEFNLAANAVETGAAEFQAFDQNNMEEYALEYLQYYAKQIKNAQVTVDRVGDTIAFEARSPSQEAVDAALAEMKRRNTEAQDKYLETHSYVRDTTGKYIMPDHIGIAQRYIGPMRPVGKALMNNPANQSPRGFVNAALNFLQSIPYDTLADRSSSNGSGFTTPYGLLLGNKGDCDIKSVALISILRGQQPRLPIIMVYTDNHAFVGVEIPAFSGDRILTIKNRVYVLTEPAGPGLFPTGKIGHSSIADLDRGYFSYIEVP